jgi:DNA polymerase elongation subunit (family B)
MKLLSIDIENSPHLVWTYKLWGNNVYIAPNMVVKQSEIMCFAAKWINENTDPMFYSTYHNGYGGMMEGFWNLMNEADALVYFNGDRFDRPKIQKSLLVAGFDPPSPAKGIDLYKIVKANFDFPYKRLDEVAKALGLEGKQGSHGANWKACLENDPEAWEREKEYNIQDAILNEQLFNIVKPWIGGSVIPSVALENGIARACRCGSTNLTKEGFRQTLKGKFQRFRCRACGTWLTSGKSVARIDLAPEPR